MRARSLSIIALLSAPLILAGCGSDSGDTATTPDDDGGTLPDGAGGGDHTSPPSDGGELDQFNPLDSGSGGHGECKEDKDCDGGYCTGKTCCASLDKVCGESCCGDAQTCFANACVTPGKDCHSSADCDPGQYCEPSLGASGDAGPGDAGAPDGMVCLAPAPHAGKCLDLPKKCPDGTAPDAGNCIPDCEYHPPVGQLHAVKKWTWSVNAKVEPNQVDVWSTPAVGRIYDTNCDGKVNDLDPPNVVFVSVNAHGTCVSCGGYSPSTSKSGRLRMLDGASGKEIWTLRRAKAGSVGFAGVSVAIGDIDKDGAVDIAAATGEGRVVLINAAGKVTRTSDKPIPQATNNGFGWGGGLAVGDMNGDGHPEIAYGSTVFTTTNGKITLKFTGNDDLGGGSNSALSTFVDLTGDGHLELLAGRTAYKFDGSKLWSRTDLPKSGYSGVGDFDKDGIPDVVLVMRSKNQVIVLDGKTGNTKYPAFTLKGNGGGPPTVADFDGDKYPEIGVAQANFYNVLKPNLTTKKLTSLWATPNHDFSSNVTGSTVFDFEGDGKAEVVYNDECFLWVYDGSTGKVRFSTPTASFTATEASLVADVDGDGHAEMIMIANGANPSASGWKCNVAPWNKVSDGTNPGEPAHPAWKPPAGQTAHRGLTLWGDKENSWVGTRTLWNEHTYHVSNICDNRDNACSAPNTYGSIPAKEKANWTVPWLNNFRQNVQDEGIFDAPDATVTLTASCTDPIVLEASLRNMGFALLPTGVEVGFFAREGGTDRLLGSTKTTAPLFPGQAQVLSYTAKSSDNVGKNSTFIAKVLIDPNALTFHECREDNNNSDEVTPKCPTVR